MSINMDSDGSERGHARHPAPPPCAGRAGRAGQAAGKSRRLLPGPLLLPWNKKRGVLETSSAGYNEALVHTSPTGKRSRYTYSPPDPSPAWDDGRPIRLRSIAVVLNLPSGYQRFLGLLPTWSSRERHNETEDLVPECIDADAVINALWNATVDDLVATSPAARADAAALDPGEWVLRVNIGRCGINQRCVEASNAPLLRRALNSACELGLDRDGEFGDWTLPCRYSRATSEGGFIPNGVVGDVAGATGGRLSQDPQPPGDGCLALGFDADSVANQTGDSTRRDPTSTDHGELQLQGSGTASHNSDAGEEVGGALAARRPVEVISISSESGSDVDLDDDDLYRSIAPPAAGADEHDAVRRIPKHPDLDEMVDKPALTAITLGAVVGGPE
ncbi:hypothetical protein VTI74DRAFT_2430 [Chaetomium olivicolor]